MGHELIVKAKGQASSTALVQFEEIVYDNLLILDSTTASFGGALKMGNIVDFINKGGNVLLIGSDQVSEALKDFAYEFSVDLKTSNVEDPFNVDLSKKGLIEGFVVPGAKNVFTPSSNPVYYSGKGHVLSGKNNLIKPVLTGKDTAFMAEGKKLNDKSIVGAKVCLVSYFQALNNARVVFSSSSSIFENEFLTNYPGNKEFAEQISAWAFQEKGVIRIKSTQHHRLGEKDQHGIYRIKDDMVYRLHLEQKKNGKWETYLPNDVQFEAVMLDPYIRANMTAIGSRLEASFKLPDQYGVFTFKVDYKRRGLSHVFASETVQVRPYRHDQYPRFLLIARPYYTNLFAFMFMFFVISAVFLLYKEPAAKKLKTD